MTEGKRKHILIVDDSLEIGELLKERLMVEGFEVHVETHGSPALLYASEHMPDLAILDLNLPDMSGYDVCRELRRLSRPWTVPVVMLTGMARPSDKLKGFASGSDVYLTKPVDTNDLIRTVAGLLDDQRAA